MNSVQAKSETGARAVVKPMALMTLILVIASLSVPAHAATGPREVVEETAMRMIAIIREHKQSLAENPSLLYGYVSEVIVPHLDFVTASRWILGKHWRTATPDQRTRFSEQFRTMLVRTYAKALLEYQDERMEFSPAVADKDPTRATVESRFYQPGTDPIPVKYRMHNRNGSWQVWDVSIAGISVVTNFRSVFSSQIREQGLDGVIEDLAARNGSSS